jgi:hypothetical protein
VPRLLHAPLDAAHSAAVVAPARLVAPRVEIAKPVAQLVVVMSALFAVHPAVHYAPVARLSL